jgi:hypothetical protein
MAHHSAAGLLLALLCAAAVCGAQGGRCGMSARAQFASRTAQG